MKYLSFDLEATGLDEQDIIIEFAMAPFCTETKYISKELSIHYYLKCPTFETLKPKLNEWVIENNEKLIRKSAKEGISLIEFKQNLTNYLESDQIKNYFDLEENKKIILFGKSMNSIDLPFLTRDLGWSYLRSFFSHQVLDLSSIVMSFIDMGLLPNDCISGSSLMNYFGMGDVAHTALEDAINTAQLYLNMTELKQLRD